MSEKKTANDEATTTVVDTSSTTVVDTSKGTKKAEPTPSGTDDLDLRKMFLAGTISIPPSLPAKATVTLKLQGAINEQYFLVKATQEVSQRVSISRTFFGNDVKAIFIPTCGRKCDLRNGEWILGPADIMRYFEAKLTTGFKGVLFVTENAQSLLETKAGLTASENAEYYPPMPQDRSNSHYNLKRVGCGQDECCDFPADDDGSGSGDDGGSCDCCC